MQGKLWTPIPLSFFMGSRSRHLSLGSVMKPFLKWAGGKSRLAPVIASLLPPSSRLVEPFAGSGAVFMGVERGSYLLGDYNEDLIHLYETLKAEDGAFVRRVEELFVAGNNNVEQYMWLRRAFNALPAGHPERSALFVYLNRHCFNGLCRYNATGGYNVPYGRPKSPQSPSREMGQFARKAARAEFVHGDFKEVLEQVRAGDVVYMDPPYVPLSATASFDAYAKGGFSLAQQADVAREAARLAKAGIPVLVSNHSTEWTRETYRGLGALLKPIEVRRSISANGGKRGEAPELLALFAREQDVPEEIRARFREDAPVEVQPVLPGFPVGNGIPADVPVPGEMLEAA